MTNLERIKERIADFDVDDFVEFCGGDTCENVLCRYVPDDDCDCRHDNHNTSYNCGDCIRKFLQIESKYTVGETAEKIL